MDQKDINLLSMKLVESRNYIETKKNVDEEILYKYEEYKYKCHEILPPKISQNFEVRYESFTVNFSDKVGNYVQKKLDLIQKADEFYNELAMAMKNLNLDEIVYFKYYSTNFIFCQCAYRIETGFFCRIIDFWQKRIDKAAKKW